MVGKSRQQKREFIAKVSRVRSREISEQIVIPNAAFDLAGDLYHLAEEAGNEAVRQFAEYMMELTWPTPDEIKAKGLPSNLSKVKYIHDFLEKAFKRKLISTGKGVFDEDYKDLKQRAFEVMLTEETKSRPITECDIQEQINEKLRFIVKRVFGDQYKDKEYTAILRSKEPMDELKSDLKSLGRSVFILGKDKQKAIDGYFSTRKSELNKIKTAAKDLNSEVRTLTKDQFEDRKVQLNEEKAKEFLKSKEKAAVRREKTKLKSYR